MLLFAKTTTIVLTIIMLIIFCMVLRQGYHGLKDGKRGLMIWVIGLASYYIISTVLCLNGVFEDFSDLPPKMMFNILPLWIVLFFTISKAGNRFVTNLSLKWLMYIQGFRILVELILWAGFHAGITPIQMTFEGLNFDILSGILGPMFAYLIYDRKILSEKFALYYNLIGMGLLLTIVTIAFMSFPWQFRVFMNEPANHFVATWPFVYIPNVFVFIAFSLHIFSFKKIAQLSKQKGL